MGRRFTLAISTLVPAVLLLVVTAARADSAFDGPYAGLTVGYLDGGFKETYREVFPTIEERIERTYFGLSGFQLEGMAGYGRTFGDTFLGAEALVGYTSAHRLDRHDVFITTAAPPFQKFENTWDMGLTYGGALRLGRLVSANTLVYLRGGYVISEFDGAVFETAGNNLSGWLAGLGTEIALSRWLNFRADYSYRGYEAVMRPFPAIPALPSFSRTDTFKPSVHVFGAGLVVNFGAENKEDAKKRGMKTPEGFSFDGFYGAALAGYTQGDIEFFEFFRNDAGGGTLVQTTDVEDKNLDGLSGEFAVGFGKTWNGIYLGGEGIAVLNRVAKADTIRDVTSGVSTIDFREEFSQHNAYGLAARAGLPIAGNMLAYLRGGYVWTTFKYDRLGELRDPSGALLAQFGFEFDDNAGGILGGAGLELALCRFLAARLDYTFTDYGKASDIFFDPNGNGPGLERVEIRKLNPRSHRIGVGFSLHLN